jgi:hypothetical protein
MNFGGALWFPIAFAVALSAIDASVAADGPLYRQLRYDEDYSYLRSNGGDDLFDPIKCIPLNRSGDAYLSFGGEARVRHEYFIIRSGAWHHRTTTVTGSSDTCCTPTPT